MWRSPDLENASRQQQCKSEKSKSQTPVANKPRQSKQRKCEQRAKVEGPQPGNLVSRAAKKSRQSARLNKVGEFTIVEALHLLIVISQGGTRRLPNEVRSARVRASIHLIGHYERASGYAVIEVTAGKRAEKTNHEQRQNRGAKALR